VTARIAQPDPERLEGIDGNAAHAQAAIDCLAQLTWMSTHGGELHPHLPQHDAPTLAAMAQAWATLAVGDEVRDMRAFLVQAVDDLREAVEAVELGVRDDDA
jgi:hypothetical protein